MVFGILKYKGLSRGLLILENGDVAVKIKAHKFGEKFCTSSIFCCIFKEVGLFYSQIIEEIFRRILCCDIYVVEM